MNWDEYWQTRSYSRKTIEFLRKKYFSKIFGRIVRKYCPKGKILETGCGSCEISVNLNKDVDYFGIEKSIEAVRIGQLRKRKIYPADLFNLPFKDKKFDLCFNQGVMEHFSKKEFKRALREMKRVARKILIIIGNEWSIWKLYDRYHSRHEHNFWRNEEVEDMIRSEFKRVSSRRIWEYGGITTVYYGEGDK